MRFVNWFWENNDWTIPLLITLIFSFVNIIFAIINAKNAVAQSKAQRIAISISLMQKRMDIYCKERSVLETIIAYKKPTKVQLEELCHIELESRFLFEKEIQEHLNTVIALTDRVLSQRKSYMPDGEGGFFEEHHDFDEEVFSQEASYLLGASISLYGRYINFSSIDINTSKKKVQK